MAEGQLYAQHASDKNHTESQFLLHGGILKCHRHHCRNASAESIRVNLLKITLFTRKRKPVHYQLNWVGCLKTCDRFETIQSSV